MKSRPKPQGKPHLESPADGPVERPPCCLDRHAMMCVERLSVYYHERPAVRDVTMPFYRGCITAIVGPSGCGKTSLLNCLNRMTDLIAGCRVAGRVTLDGRDVFDPSTDLVALRRRVGMIFQKPNPFPLSVRRNLTFPLQQHGMKRRQDRDEAVERSLVQVGLWDEVKDRLDAAALSLSGGQQQRLCLARALVLDPEVLLLDEPCSALDPIAGGVVEDLIASLRGRYTVIIVTHNLAQARRIADDLAVFWLRDGAGTLLERGQAATVFASPADPLTASYLDGLRG